MSLNIQYISKDNQIESAHSLESVPADTTFRWFDYDSYNDKDQLIENFNIDGNLLEDEITKKYRPQHFNLGEYQILICHVIDEASLKAHSINICVMKDTVVTYHDGVLKDFIDIEKIIKNKNEDLEIDVALNLLLATVDQYFEVVHEIEDDVISFEDHHGDEKRGKDISSQMFELRKRVMRVKRVIIPMEELVDKFNDEKEIFSSDKSADILSKIETRIDRQKLIIHFSDEMIDELKDNYISYNTYRMNKIINVLTIISAVFLPLMLITGIYGMNFDHMPELGWDYGYYMSLAAMAIISAAMIIFFKYKGWM